mgnify:CR=1 FL=1
MLTLQAADLRQRGQNIGKLAAMAKYYASENAVTVTNKALQIHGGYGYMKEYAIERMYRDARITTLYEGTSEVQKMVISGAMKVEIIAEGEIDNENRCMYKTGSGYIGS